MEHRNGSTVTATGAEYDLQEQLHDFWRHSAFHNQTKKMPTTGGDLTYYQALLRFVLPCHPA